MYSYLETEIIPGSVRNVNILTLITKWWSQQRLYHCIDFTKIYETNKKIYKCQEDEK